MPNADTSVVADAAEASIDVKTLNGGATFGGVTLEIMAAMIQQDPAISGRVQYGTYCRECGSTSLTSNAGTVSMRMTIRRG